MCYFWMKLNTINFFFLFSIIVNFDSFVDAITLKPLGKVWYSILMAHPNRFVIFFFKKKFAVNRDFFFKKYCSSEFSLFFNDLIEPPNNFVINCSP